MSITTVAVSESARNLFTRCAGLSPGAKILIVGEADDAPYFDPDVCRTLAKEAEALGLEVDLCFADAQAAAIPQTIVEKMHGVAATFFFSRLGGRARFDVPDVPGMVVNCHGETPAHMAGPFTQVDYRVQNAIHGLLKTRIAAAQRYRITAPCGTNLTGTVPRGKAEPMVDFALRIFPVMIFPPILCENFHGSLVIDHFVTSSATRLYNDSLLRIDTPIVATIADGRMVETAGPEELVARLHAQMSRAAALTGGDPMRINSWHTGINPNTFTKSQAMADPDRWGAIAFGAPRYTHFHAAGHDPGDVAFSLLDATISFDDVAFWKNGQFAFLDLPEVAALIPEEVKPVFHAALRPPIGI